MADHVYWKQLRVVLNFARRYIVKWQIQLQQHLTTPQYQCVVAVLDAIITCLGALPEEPPIT